MTDVVFYADMDALAAELMADFGSSATLRSVAVSAPNDQGKVVKAAPVDSPGLAVQTLSETVSNLMLEATQVKLVYKGPREPKVGYHVLHAGKEWEVKEVKLAAPLGVMIIAFLGCNKPV